MLWESSQTPPCPSGRGQGEGLRIWRNLRPSPGASDLRLSRRSEEHTSELQSQSNLVCRLLLEKKNKIILIDILHAFTHLFTLTLLQPAFLSTLRFLLISITELLLASKLSVTLHKLRCLFLLSS